jgi:hypothetical protein
MEQIQFQIDQTLYRIRLARPTRGHWSGEAASSLESALQSLETELLALRAQLLW